MGSAPPGTLKRNLAVAALALVFATIVVEFAFPQFSALDAFSIFIDYPRVGGMVLLFILFLIGAAWIQDNVGRNRR